MSSLKTEPEPKDDGSVDDGRVVDDFKRGIHAFATASLVLPMGVALVYFWWFRGPLSTNSNEWNNFGAFFGGTVTPILSALTAMGVLFALLLQRRQVNLAEQAARESQVELSRIAELQEQTARAQRETAAAMTEQIQLATVSVKMSMLVFARQAVDAEIAEIDSTDPSAAEKLLNLKDRRNHLIARKVLIDSATQQLVDAAIQEHIAPK